jgi:hypothetical protein
VAASIRPRETDFKMRFMKISSDTGLTRES